MVRHVVSRGDCLRPGEHGEFFLATNVGRVGGEDDEVGCEGRCVDFVVVAAGADEGAEHVGAGNGLRREG